MMIIERDEWASIKEKLEALFWVSFGHKIPTGYLDWRYFDNYQEKLLFAVEFLDDSLAASYSAFPIELTVDGNYFPTSMSMTTMTHPSVRGKGLFPKLAGELYSLAEVFEISAIFGFPNNNSHQTFCNKLGWTDIYEIPTMVLHSDDLNLNSMKLSAIVGRDDGFLMQYQDPPKDGLLRIYKSIDYLTWRYVKNPVNNYQNYVISRSGLVSSYVVAKPYKNGLDLVDIQALNIEDADILLRHIAIENFSRGVLSISCWAPTHHFIHGVLERIGFKNQNPITYFGAKELIASSMPAGWLNYKNWYIQMGDSDVY